MAEMKRNNLLTINEGMKILALCRYIPAPSLKGIQDAVNDSYSTFSMLEELRRKTETNIINDLMADSCKFFYEV